MLRRALHRGQSDPGPRRRRKEAMAAVMERWTCGASWRGAARRCYRPRGARRCSYALPGVKRPPALWRFQRRGVRLRAQVYDGALFVLLNDRHHSTQRCAPAGHCSDASPSKQLLRSCTLRGRAHPSSRPNQGSWRGRGCRRAGHRTLCMLCMMANSSASMAARRRRRRGHGCGCAVLRVFFRLERHSPVAYLTGARRHRPSRRRAVR